AGNYTLSSTTATTAANITAAPVTAAITASDKPYDGTTAAATVCALTGVLGSDVVTCNGTSTFDTPDVGRGKAVTATGLSLGGAAAANYALTATTTSTTANITAILATPAMTAASKPYDGTTAATISCTLSGTVAGDDVACIGNAAFDSASAGAAKTVTSHDVTLVGVDASNYTLSTVELSTSAAITARSVAPSLTVANRPYNGLTTANVTGCTLTGLIPGDNVSCSGTAAFTSKAVGIAKVVVIDDITLIGADAANYALTSTLAATTATIMSLSVEPTITVASRAYDRGTSATLTSCSVAPPAGAADPIVLRWDSSLGTGPVLGYLLTIHPSAGVDETIDLGMQTSYVVSNAVAGVQYSFAVTAYNGGGPGTSVELSAVAQQSVIGAGDTVGCTGSAAFETASAGAAKTASASGLTLTGSDAGNYALAVSTATTSAAITALSVTPDIADASKTYDGTTAATLISCTLTGVLSGDSVGCTGGAAFDTAAAGAGKTVTVNALTLTGPAAGNYVISTTSSVTSAAIAPLAVTPSITVADKVYDGTASATVTACTLTGVIGADAVGCSGPATFDSATAGAGKLVTASPLTLTGAAAINYTLSATSATATATIARVTVTPTVVIASKVYDGTLTATIASCTVSGLVGGDSVTCTGTATFQSAGAGDAKPVVVHNLSLVGPAAPNYQLVDANFEVQPLISIGASGDIEPAIVTPAISAASKTYDATAAATIAGTLTGVVGGDVVSCAGTGTFDTAAVGTAKTVTSTNLTL